MKKKMVSVLLAAAMGTTALVGFGTTAYADDDVLEFYHGYYQDESEWAAAQVMRDIYDEFAKEHADGSVTFKPIAVENRDDIVSAQVAGGSFPDLVDVGGGGVPQAALSQDLVYDLKPYIDENGLQDAVGLNYTQHDMDGHIYAVHDQIESRGLWYNSDIFEKAGITEEAFADWDSFGEAMEKIRALDEDVYGYIAGQGSSYIVNTVMASTDAGKKMLDEDTQVAAGRKRTPSIQRNLQLHLRLPQIWIRQMVLSTRQMITEILWQNLIQMARQVSFSMVYGMQVELMLL